MENPTTVKIEFYGTRNYGSILASKFLELGYNVIPVNCPHAAINNHKFSVSELTKHDWHFFCDDEDITFWNIAKPEEKYVFRNKDENPVIFCNFIIGNWGTVRGGRSKYKPLYTNFVDEKVVDDWIIDV